MCRRGVILLLNGDDRSKKTYSSNPKNDNKENEEKTDFSVPITGLTADIGGLKHIKFNAEQNVSFTK